MNTASPRVWWELIYAVIMFHFRAKYLEIDHSYVRAWMYKRQKHPQEPITHKVYRKHFKGESMSKTLK